MTKGGQVQNLAVLIDADNTSARHAHAIFEEIVKLGEANVRRIYGDFSGNRLAGWDGAIESLAILQHQQRFADRPEKPFLPGLSAAVDASEFQAIEDIVAKLRPAERELTIDLNRCPRCKGPIVEAGNRGAPATTMRGWLRQRHPSPRPGSR